MANYKTKKSLVGNIILIIVLILAITMLSVFVFGDFRKKPDTPPVTDDPPVVTDKFAVTFNGNTYEYGQDDEISLILPDSGQVKFDVAGTESYTVKVVTNINDGGSSPRYYYYVDGQLCVFPADDYTTEFIKSENVHDSYFTIESTPGYYDLTTLLKRMYNTDNVTFNKEITAVYPYKLQIKSANGEVIEILLSQAKSGSLKTPTLNVEITSVESNRVNVLLRYGNIDVHADKIYLHKFSGGEELTTDELSIDKNEQTLGLLVQGEWEFYIEVSDSTGAYLKGVSERVQIRAQFSD